MMKTSKQVTVFYDPQAKKLSVWFGPQTDTYDTETIADDCLLMKMKSGETIGFIRLNYTLSENEQLQFAFEIVSY